MHAISAATIRDAHALVTLRTAVAHDMTRRYGAGHWSTCPSNAEVKRQLRASRVLVARRNADIIGTVRLARALPGAFDSSAFSPVAMALYVLGLAVAPEARGQGVGRRLMDAAKDTARSMAANALWLDAYDHAAGAGRFYLANGFRAVGGTKRDAVPLIYYEWLVPERADTAPS
jgi:GNAT superfamily N-acetyltransferase